MNKGKVKIVRESNAWPNYVFGFQDVQQAEEWIKICIDRVEQTVPFLEQNVPLTEEVSQALLARSKQNRETDPGIVRKYATAIEAGSFDGVKERIEVSRYGRLIAGQNALKAALGSFATPVADIFFGAPSEDEGVVTGRGKLASLAAWMQKENPDLYASALRSVVAVEKGLAKLGGRSMLTRPMFARMAVDPAYFALEDAARLAAAMTSLPFSKTVIAAGAFFMIKEHGLKSTERFFADFGRWGRESGSSEKLILNLVSGAPRTGVKAVAALVFASIHYFAGGNIRAWVNANGSPIGAPLFPGRSSNGVSSTIAG